MTWLFIRTQLLKQKPFEWQRMHVFTSPLNVGTQRKASLLKTSPMREPSGKIYSGRLELLTTWRSSVALEGVLFDEGSEGEGKDGMRHGGSMPAKR